MTVTSDLPLSLARLHDPDVLADPYPFYERLRTEDPVHWEELEAGFTRWALTRYEDIAMVLRDPRSSAQRQWGVGWLPEESQPTAERVQEAYQRQVLFVDAPDHTRLRRLMMSAFTPRVVAGMRPLIQQLVDQMLDAVAPAGAMDVIADLAYPLPTSVIAAMLGVPPQDRSRFQAWATDMGTTFDGDPARPERAARAYEGVIALLEYMADLVRQRRRSPQDDLTQALIAASDAGDVLNTDEVVANAALLLVAGHETTTNLIGNGLLALLRHPEQMERLRAEPDLIESGVEELLRYDSPVQMTARLAKEDLEIGGRHIEAGQLILVLLGAANRDPAQFGEPDRLDASRAENRHLSFAYGPHFCLGAALARLEGQIAFSTLLRRWSRLELASETVGWRDNATLRGLVALPVTFGR
jgi:cytochrome P450